MTPESEGNILGAFTGPSGHGEYSRKFGSLFKKWDEQKKFESLTCKSLRKTLETQAEIHGWSGYIFNAYLGRAPRSVQERHYIQAGLTEEQKQNLFTSKVVSQIDEVVDSLLKERSICECFVNRPHNLLDLKAS